MKSELVEIQRYDRRPLPTMRDLAAVVFRQRRIIVMVFAAVVAVVFMSGIWIRKYEAHMKILVLHQRTDAMVSATANAPTQDNGTVTEEDLNSEVEILHSEDLLRKVVLQTGLQSSTRFLFWHQEEPKATASAIRTLDRNLEIEPIRRANVISVKYRSSDPELAAKVLNAVASAYMEKHMEVHRPSGEFTFFDQQRDQFQHELDASQAQLAEFTKKNGVVSAELERDLTLQRLADFSATAHAAQASEQETANRIQSLQAQIAKTQPRETTQVRTAENSQLMQQLKSTLLTLELKRTELLTKYDPSYRLVQEVDKQIAEAHSAIALEQSRPAQEVTTDQDPTYAMLRSELAKAQADLSGFQARAAATRMVAEEYRADARRLVQQGIEQSDLMRESKTQEENYLLYSKKREEARISDALDQRGIMNVALAEKPVVPAIPSQSPMRTGGVTLLLAFFVSLGAGFIADFADPSFRTPDEVVGYLEMPVLASLPKRADR